MTSCDFAADELKKLADELDEQFPKFKVVVEQLPTFAKLDEINKELAEVEKNLEEVDSWR